MLTTIIAYALLIMTGIGFVVTVLDRVFAKATALPPEEAVPPEEKTEPTAQEGDAKAAPSIPQAAPVRARIRIPENLLLIISCLLGGIGVTLGFFLAKRGLYKPETRLGIPAVALGETILAFQLLPGLWEALMKILGM